MSVTNRLWRFFKFYPAAQLWHLFAAERNACGGDVAVEVVKGVGQVITLQCVEAFGELDTDFLLLSFPSTRLNSFCSFS